MERAVPQHDLLNVLDSTVRSLWRLELQPRCEVGEGDEVEAFGNGAPLDPSRRQAAWHDLVRSWRARGVDLHRVRVHEDAPTLYQQWVRWTAAWNADAGESFRYVSRSAAITADPAFALPAEDYWFLDKERVLRMPFAPDGTPGDYVLTDEAGVVAEANGLWKVAFSVSAPESFSGIARQVVIQP
ncbi:DUF6879 family protein [Salininema proteolyticum]|uniref:DUF6879 family protein n=1 Tax=Salininema proteolyticum TaxID=1607685 RepID=A0ABV8U4Q5_9ACTN